MITVDGRFFDTDHRWHHWCREHGIKDPFKERYIHDDYQHYTEIDEHGHEIFIWEKDDSPEYKAWEADWEKRRDEYLRQMHTFRLWDLHFWMEDWDNFQSMGKGGYVDMSIYLPCDIGNRQCAMTCAYFGTECPRARGEELISPIPGLEGRYEYKTSDTDNRD